MPYLLQPCGLTRFAQRVETHRTWRSRKDVIFSAPHHFLSVSLVSLLCVFDAAAIAAWLSTPRFISSTRVLLGFCDRKPGGKIPLSISRRFFPSDPRCSCFSVVFFLSLVTFFHFRDFFRGRCAKGRGGRAPGEMLGSISFGHALEGGGFFIRATSVPRRTIKKDFFLFSSERLLFPWHGRSFFFSHVAPERNFFFFF
ncbi:hypothetical protein DM02DRAFT_84465 [Periconia macrospinosa]|uniref:Transmembrane protein n=1 Tax=Periconia macrospinosa TaxID=97972 RepID=A0A2V1E629_9PLEO|nr:hypothetical protein DM02DRAFT_84465 [Periconia macrospinosa]